MCVLSIDDVVVETPIRNRPNKAEMGLANIARAGAQDTGLKRKWCGLHITNIGKGVTTVAGTENIDVLRCTGKYAFALNTLVR